MQCMRDSGRVGGEEAWQKSGPPRPDAMLAFAIAWSKPGTSTVATMSSTPACSPPTGPS